MSQPTASWSLDWVTPFNPAQKLSNKTFVDPSGNTHDCTYVPLTVKPAVHAKFLYVTSVKADGRDYGFIDDILVDIQGSTPTGHQVFGQGDVAANQECTANITCVSHLCDGEGDYRIGVYVQNDDGFWNYEYFFITLGGDPLKTSASESFKVPVQTT